MLHRGSRLRVQGSKDSQQKSEAKEAPPPPELHFDNETDPKCTVAVLVGAPGLASAALAAFRGLGLKATLVARPPSALPTAGDTFLLRIGAGGKVAVADLPLVRAPRAGRAGGSPKVRSSVFAVRLAPPLFRPPRAACATQQLLFRHPPGAPPSPPLVRAAR